MYRRAVFARCRARMDTTITAAPCAIPCPHGSRSRRGELPTPIVKIGKPGLAKPARGLRARNPRKDRRKPRRWVFRGVRSSRPQAHAGEDANIRKFDEKPFNGKGAVSLFDAIFHPSGTLQSCLKTSTYQSANASGGGVALQRAITAILRHNLPTQSSSKNPGQRFRRHKQKPRSFRSGALLIANRTGNYQLRVISKRAAAPLALPCQVAFDVTPSPATKPFGCELCVLW